MLIRGNIRNYCVLSRQNLLVNPDEFFIKTYGWVACVCE